MDTKLTLTVSETVIEKAKSYAKQTGRSLSEWVVNYLRTPTKKTKIGTGFSQTEKDNRRCKASDDFNEEGELRVYF